MTDAPLPPPRSDMTFADRDMFSELTEGAFYSPPGVYGMEIRDIGFGKRTGGRVGVQIFRASGDVADPPLWHMHDLDIQIGYIISGWILYEFEGLGVVRVEAGTAIRHLPRNRLRVLDRSSDFEGIWVKSPAEDVVTLFPVDDTGGYGEVIYTHTES